MSAYRVLVGVGTEPVTLEAVPDGELAEALRGPGADLTVAFRRAKLLAGWKRDELPAPPVRRGSL